MSLVVVVRSNWPENCLPSPPLPHPTVMHVFKPTAVALKEKVELFGGSSVSPKVVKLTFSLPDPTSSLHSLGFDLGLGDFVRFRFPGTRARAYSPTSHPSTIGTFTIIIRVYPKGQVSPKLAALNLGDKADVIGPLPVPWLTRKRNATKHLALVAFGVGIIELVSLLRSELLSETLESITVLWCLRRREEMTIGSDLEDYSTEKRIKFEVRPRSEATN